jgi:hypothetical protein
VFKRCDQCDVYKPEVLFAPYGGDGNTKRCAQCRHLIYDTGFGVMRPKTAMEEKYDKLSWRKMSLWWLHRECWSSIRMKVS